MTRARGRRVSQRAVHTQVHRSARRTGRSRAAAVAVFPALAVVAVVLAACASGSGSAGAPASSSTATTTARSAPSVRTTTPQAAATVVHVFAPFDSSGAPVAGVTAHRSGSCFTSSITVAARHAYRCFAGSEILDPCFARTAGAHTLTCYLNPWSGAIQLRVTAALPAGSAGPVVRPWALELAGGSRCVVVTGTVDVVQQVPMTYRCGARSAGLVPRGGAARVALLRSADGTATRVPVVAAWRA